MLWKTVTPAIEQSCSVFKCHRRVGVCVLWKYLVLVFLKFRYETWHGHSLGPCGWHGVGKVALRRSGFALRAKRVIGQRGKKIFCISMRFRAFWVDWDTLFFSKIFVSAKRKTRASEASKMRACWSDWMYQSFIKKKIILIFRNCVCCERLWPLRSSNLVAQTKVWEKISLWYVTM